MCHTDKSKQHIDTAAEKVGSEFDGYSTSIMITSNEKAVNWKLVEKRTRAETVQDNEYQSAHLYFSYCVTTQMNQAAG